MQSGQAGVNIAGERGFGAIETTVTPGHPRRCGEMTLTHRIDREAGIVYVDVIGSFTMADIRALIDGVVNDPDFRRGYHILSDHRRIGDPATVDQVRGTVEHVATHMGALGSSKWAIVASKMASYGMMRMMATLAEDLPMQVSVFRDLAQARLWLSGASSDR